MTGLWPLPDDPLVKEVLAACEALRLPQRYRQLDQAPAFPRAEFRALGERHLLGLTVPTAVGGRGLPLVRAAAVLFRLAYASGTTFAKLALQPEFCSVLRTRGSAEQVARWFRPVLAGERLVGNQITEPGAGSDVRALTSMATRTPAGYRLNGTKSEAAFASDAEDALVYARAGDSSRSSGITAFLVPQEAAGVTRAVEPVDMGERWQRRGTVTYADLELPESSRVGAEGDALPALVDELVRERGLLAAIYLGVARASLDETVAYVGSREAFGRRLADQQGVAFPLVDAAVELEGAWLVVRSALERLDGGEDASAQTALAKAWATRVALATLDLAIQFHGGRGYSSREVHEQRYRDVRSGTIAHGSTEVLRQNAARTLWPPGRPGPSDKA
jgi:cyclohexanecarboxyl-CoA dehydrogenase